MQHDQRLAPRQRWRSMPGASAQGHRSLEDFYLRAMGRNGRSRHAEKHGTCKPAIGDTSEGRWPPGSFFPCRCCVLISSIIARLSASFEGSRVRCGGTGMPCFLSSFPAQGRWAGCREGGSEILQQHELSCAGRCNNLIRIVQCGMAMRRRHVCQSQSVSAGGMPLRWKQRAGLRPWGPYAGPRWHSEGHRHQSVVCRASGALAVGCRGLRGLCLRPEGI